MAEPQVLVSEPKDGIVVVTLNRAKQGNALRIAMYGVIADAFVAAEANKAVKAVVLTGAGNFFSTGADVMEGMEKMMGGADPEDLIKDLQNFPIRLTSTLINFKKISVAAVNGPVVGYPAGLLGLFDQVLISDSATLQTPFFHLGLVTEGCSSRALSATVGHQTYMNWLLTNRVVDAKEMVSSRLASKIYPTEGFLNAVLADLAGQLKASPISSILASKELMQGPHRESYHQGNKREFELLAAQFQAGVPIKQFQAVAKNLKGKKSKSKL